MSQLESWYNEQIKKMKSILLPSFITYDLSVFRLTQEQKIKAFEHLVFGSADG
jgi:hypothetical protein